MTVRFFSLWLLQITELSTNQKTNKTVKVWKPKKSRVGIMWCSHDLILQHPIPRSGYFSPSNSKVEQATCRFCSREAQTSMSMKIRLSSRQDTIIILDALQITVDDVRALFGIWARPAEISLEWHLLSQTNGLAPDRRRALQSQLVTLSCFPSLKVSYGFSIVYATHVIPRLQQRVAACVTQNTKNEWVETLKPHWFE